MLALVVLLSFQSLQVVTPPPPAGVGPHQEGVPVPAPLALSEVEQEMGRVFGAVIGIATITCDGPDVKRRVDAANARLLALHTRLQAAVTRERGSRIVRGTMSDPSNVYLPGCPAKAATDERIERFEKAADSLDAALTRAGH